MKPVVQSKKGVRLLALATAVGALGVAVSGCVPLVLGGAAVGGTMVATDRRDSSTLLDDQGIEMRVGRQIYDAVSGSSHVNVTSWAGRVLLTGEVQTEQDKQRAEQVARVIGQIRIGRLQRASVVFGSDELIDFAIVFPHQRGLRSLRHGRTAAQQRSGCQHNTCRDSRKKSWLHHEQNTSTIRQLVHYPLFPS